jgi:NAD(P)-dependent dehydrogenase (short-subunit alcohol dehydrogenase family)
MSTVWLITGAARGLGRTLAERVLDAGDWLVAGTRNPERLADLRERHGGRLLPVTLDVTDESAAHDAVQLALEVFGQIDVLVNTAGSARAIPFVRMGTGDFRDQIETGLFGIVNLARAVVPAMLQQRSGRIVQVSPTAGETRGTGLTAFHAAVGAIGGFTKSLAWELAPSGVSVTTIEPGEAPPCDTVRAIQSLAAHDHPPGRSKPQHDAPWHGASTLNSNAFSPVVPAFRIE